MLFIIAYMCFIILYLKYLFYYPISCHVKIRQSVLCLCLWIMVTQFLDLVVLFACSGFIVVRDNYIRRTLTVPYLAKLYLAIEIFILRSYSCVFKNMRWVLLIEKNSLLNLYFFPWVIVFQVEDHQFGKLSLFFSFLFLSLPRSLPPSVPSSSSVPCTYIQS